MRWRWPLQIMEVASNGIQVHAVDPSTNYPVYIILVLEPVVCQRKTQVLKALCLNISCSSTSTVCWFDFSLPMFWCSCDFDLSAELVAPNISHHTCTRCLPWWWSCSVFCLSYFQRCTQWAGRTRRPCRINTRVYLHWTA